MLDRRVGSKEECLNRMIFVGQASLRRSVGEYVEHYHHERNHQGLENRLLRSPPEASGHAGAISCHTGLGGVLNYYYRMAA
jgi:hypothetical protein